MFLETLRSLNLRPFFFYIVDYGSHPEKCQQPGGGHSRGHERSGDVDYE